MNPSFIYVFTINNLEYSHEYQIRESLPIQIMNKKSQLNQYNSHFQIAATDKQPKIKLTNFMEKPAHNYRLNTPEPINQQRNRFN